MELTKTQDIKAQLQNFLMKLSQDPPVEELERTPDGKAKTLPISFIETKLDEIYLGQWDTSNYTTKVISNEVCGELELIVVNPITGRETRRTGAAAIIIQMHKAPDNLDDQEKTRWATDPANKKTNALDLGYPKLKAECVKNAAQSLGKIFGRDLNRKKVDVYRPEYSKLSDKGFEALLQRIEAGDRQAIALAESNFVLDDLQMEILSGLKNGQKQLNNGSI